MQRAPATPAAPRAALRIRHTLPGFTTAASVLALCTSAAAAAAADAPGPIAIDPRHARPAIVVGDPFGSPPVTSADRVSPNVPTSAFAGVVSINTANNQYGSFLGSGTLVHPRYVLTAAHLVDVAGGFTFDFQSTGDGVADFSPGQATVVFNHDNPSSTTGGATLAAVANIYLHPNWHGFNNFDGPEGSSINDDLAVLELAEPAPAGVPFYPLSGDPFAAVQPLVLAGYGMTGHGTGGLEAGTANFFVKRSGLNLAGAVDFDDEAPNDAAEIFAFDFDGPDDSTDTYGDGPTFGNDLEVMIGPGDSGGPSFTWLDLDNDGDFDADELTLFGVNTFTAGGGGLADSPLFGSLGGGVLVSGYVPFLQSVIPEPAALPLVGLALFVVSAAGGNSSAVLAAGRWA